ncbi:MAG: ankyrin repeat domain-containing protein [Flavobacteriaceae bacterium]|nr:ankyrin repeat domain-containing protein [Flavobacteriaceae bacterium]
MRRLENNKSFFAAIREGLFDTVKKSIEADNSLLHLRDNRGASPLILASYYNHIDIVQYLIEMGADINEKDAMGNTALMGACFKGYSTTTKLLLELGVDANCTNLAGSTALMFAVLFDQKECVEILIENGADLDVRDHNGNTAADIAKDNKLHTLVELLKA